MPWQSIGKITGKAGNVEVKGVTKLTSSASKGAGEAAHLGSKGAGEAAQGAEKAGAHGAAEGAQGAEKAGAHGAAEGAQGAEKAGAHGAPPHTPEAPHAPPPSNKIQRAGDILNAAVGAGSLYMLAKQLQPGDDGGGDGGGGGGGGDGPACPPIQGYKCYQNGLGASPIQSYSDWTPSKCASNCNTDANCVAFNVPVDSNSKTCQLYDSADKPTTDSSKFLYVLDPDAPPPGTPGAPSSTGTPGAPSSTGTPGAPSSTGTPGTPGGAKPTVGYFDSKNPNRTRNIGIVVAMVVVLLLMIMCAIFSMSKSSPPPNSALNHQSPAPNLKR